MASKTDVRAHPRGSNHLTKFYDFALSNSYTTDGEFIDLAADFDEIDGVSVAEGGVDAGNDRVFEGVLSGTFAGVKSYQSTTGLAETSGAVDLSGTTVRLRVEGLVKGGVDTSIA